MTKRLALITTALGSVLACLPLRSAAFATEYVAACTARIEGAGGKADAAQTYCACAEAQLKGELTDRDVGAVVAMMRGRDDAFSAAYPELDKQQFAERLVQLDEALARLAKKTDEACGQPEKAPPR